MKKFLLSMVLLLSLSACSTKKDAITKNDEGLVSLDIQIDGSATPYYSPLYLAKEKGYFKDEGLDINFYYASAAEIVKNVGADNVAFGFPNADVVLLGRANGVPVKIIHTTYQSGLGSIIYKDSANIKEPADLKGKTIAITSYGSPNFVQLKVILQQAGLSLDDINLKVIGTGAIVNSLVSDQVNAICFSKLRTYELLSSGIAVDQILSSDFMPSYGNVVITSDKFLAEQPELCAAFNRALSKAIAYISDGHVEEAVDIAKMSYTPNINGSEQKYIDIISKEFIQNLWQSDNTKLYGTGYSDLEEYQTYINILKDNGLFKEAFSASDLAVNLDQEVLK